MAIEEGAALVPLVVLGEVNSLRNMALFDWPAVQVRGAAVRGSARQRAALAWGPALARPAFPGGDVGPLPGLAWRGVHWPGAMASEPAMEALAASMGEPLALGPRSCGVQRWSYKRLGFPIPYLIAGKWGLLPLPAKTGLR